MNFDLVSDLHIDAWPNSEQIPWVGLPTSLICVVAGDVSSNPDYTLLELTRLSVVYKHIIFIDGNNEHRFNNYSSVVPMQQYLHAQISRHFTNVTYLYDKVAIVNNVAFIGANGWWTYDYGEPDYSSAECRNDFEIAAGTYSGVSESLLHVAEEDAEFLCFNLNKLQYQNNIQDIVLVTHTVPNRQLISKNWNMKGTYYQGTVGNTLMETVLDYDYQGKVKAWCFGHCHDETDKMIGDVRFVSNPRGRPNDFNRKVYYPKLITL
jgi:hypothetical protein